MLQVQILDVCPYCEGVSMVFVGMDEDYRGQPFERYRPCAMCHGSGEYPRWVPLSEFAELVRQALCPHEHTSTQGRMHFSAGDVWDDIQAVCDDCGAKLDV